MPLQQDIPEDKVAEMSTPPPENTMEHDKRLSRPNKTFEVELEPVNCGVSGISYDTLEAIAHSYGITEERIIHQALLQLALKEIPGFDTDAPFLSDEQLERLRARREQIDQQAEIDRASPAVHEVLKNFLRIQGEADENTEDPGSASRGST